VLDPDDPDAQAALEGQGLVGNLQAAMRAMMPRVQAGLTAATHPSDEDLGPPVDDLARTRPYPHIAPLLDELRRYAATKLGGPSSDDKES